MRLGGIINAPLKWVAFAMQFPADAQVSPERSHSGADLFTVNTQINSAIVFDDSTIEREWQLFPTHGCCHDYVMSKRHRLLNLGWPSSALLACEVVPAVAGPNHLVLLSQGNSGWVVLDNRVDVLRVPERTGYRGVRCQTPDDPNVWAEVDFRP